MKKLPAIIILFILSCVLWSGNKLPGKDPELLSPSEYLVSEFSKKDIILLGEFHRIKEYPEFVADLIPVLHHHGINILFSEFASFEDSKRIDSLINASAYNEKLAREIQFHNSWDWGYKEYVDIYYAAWKLNHSLKKGEVPFKIIGLEKNDYGDMDPDQSFAKLVTDSAILIKKKALVYCGINHAFTNFHHPYIIHGKVEGFVSNRMGNFLFRKYPEKVITVLLHGPFPTRESFPYCGMPLFVKSIDSMVYRLPAEKRMFGFATAGTYAGQLKDHSSFYSQGYDTLCLENLCQGYIMLKPVCELSFVTCIPGFIDNSNVRETRKTANMGELSAHDFNDTLKAWRDYEASFLAKLKDQNCHH